MIVIMLRLQNIVGDAVEVFIRNLSQQSCIQGQNWPSDRVLSVDVKSWVWYVPTAVSRRCSIRHQNDLFLDCIGSKMTVMESREVQIIRVHGLPVLEELTGRSKCIEIPNAKS